MKTTNSRYNTPNKFITLTKVTLVPSIILNTIIMFLLFGFVISKNDLPEWLTVIAAIVMGVSSITWLIASTVMFIEGVWPEIKKDLRGIYGKRRRDC